MASALWSLARPSNLKNPKDAYTRDLRGTSQINTRSDILSSRRIWASFGKNLPGIRPKSSPSTLPIKSADQELLEISGSRW
jgi:hypothetical protein